MPGPRKPETIRLHSARRQVFQWHFREDLPLRILKQRMDQLSRELVDITGEDFIASEGAWEGRIDYWNRRSPERWNIKKRQRGPDVPIPADIVDVPYWREWGVNVGDWAERKNCLLSKYNLHNAPQKPSTAVSIVAHSMNQAPAPNLAFWKAQEGQDWGLSTSSESGTSRLPSLCSGTSRSTGSCSHESLPMRTYSQDPKTNDARSTSWLDTASDLGMNTYQPQLAHSGNYNDQEAFCDGTLLTVTPAGAPQHHQAGFSYEAHQNMTVSRHARHGADMSYNSPHSHDPGLAMARPLQADQRLLYMPPEQEGVAHQMINYNHNDNTNGLMAPPPLDASSAASTLRLPPRVTVQHTMGLYGEYIPQEGFYDTS